MISLPNWKWNALCGNAVVLMVYVLLVLALVNRLYGVSLTKLKVLLPLIAIRVSSDVLHVLSLVVYSDDATELYNSVWRGWLYCK